MLRWWVVDGGCGAGGYGAGMHLRCGEAAAEMQLLGSKAVCAGSAYQPLTMVLRLYQIW